MYLVYDFGVDFDSCLEMLLSLSTVSLLCTLFDVSTAFLWSDTLSFRDKNQESVRRIWKVLLFFPLSEAVMPLFNVLKQMAERRLREARQRIWICFAFEERNGRKKRKKWSREEGRDVERITCKTSSTCLLKWKTGCYVFFLRFVFICSLDCKTFSFHIPFVDFDPDDDGVGHHISHDMMQNQRK